MYDVGCRYHFFWERCAPNRTVLQGYLELSGEPVHFPMHLTRPRWIAGGLGGPRVDFPVQQDRVVFFFSFLNQGGNEN